MLKRLASLTFLLFLSPSVWGATYYVATNGNDSAVGDISHPWLTIRNSFAHVAAGDTVKVGQGIYAETGDTGLSYTGSSGTSNAPITFDGQGAAYITKWWFASDVQYVVIKGFHIGWNYWSTYQMGGFGAGAHHCQYLSNYFRPMGVGQSGNSEGGVGWGQEAAPWGTNDASYCLVQGNVFENFTGVQCLGIAGDNNLIQYNVFRDCPAPEAALYIWGRTNTIRGNLFTNLWTYSGCPGHPDVFQTFGDNGYGAQDILIEGNYVINCDTQIGSLQSATAAGEVMVGYITNNTVSFVLTNSAPIPGTVASPMKVFPTYLRVSTNGCANYLTTDNGLGAISGYGFTGTVDYTNGNVTLNYTAADGFQIALCYDWQRVCPYVTNWVFRNNVIVNVGSPLHVTLPGFQMLNNTFYQCGWDSDLGFAVTWNKSINGNADNGVIANNVFLLCGNNAQSESTDYGWYCMSGQTIPGQPAGMVIENNYLGGENWSTKNPALILGTNIVNGGDPKLMRAWPLEVTNLYNLAAQSATNFDWSTWSNRYRMPDLHPFASSPLVGAGTNLSAQFTNDFDGNTRSGSGAWTIGAYEFEGSTQTSGLPVAPSLTGQPQSASVSAGSTATFSMTATGTAPLSYQWQFNGANIADATASSYTKNNVQASDAGRYSVVVANAAGSITSAGAVLTVTTPSVPPSLTAQPQSATVSVGSTASFSMAATGTAPLSYQWQFNGANIAGATSDTYTKNNVQAGDAGGYSVVVSNAAGSVTSASAVLTVTAASVPPSLTAQPQSATVHAGNTATFSVAATGRAPLSYQWRFSGANISGATGSTYARPAVQSADAGNYSVVVANLAGTVTSADAWLIVTRSVATVADSSLKLHLDFDEDFSSGQVVDTSGNGNDGWQFDPTNRITPTPGVLGGTAAQFSLPGTYLAVTNLDGFAYLTNGTISVWAKFAPNGDRAMRILDNGYTPGYARNPAAASNSWALCRDYTPNLTFLVYPPGGARQQVVSWPDDTVRSGGSQPDLSTTGFHLYSVTIDCPNNQAIAYYDGQPWMTNSINLPWIRVYGCAGQPWLCIGAASSDGTPQWGDDAYPGYGFMAGSLDDLRIYNRTLRAADVKALYTGQPTPPVAFHIVGP